MYFISMLLIIDRKMSITRRYFKILVISENRDGEISHNQGLAQAQRIMVIRGLAWVSRRRIPHMLPQKFSKNIPAEQHYSQTSNCYKENFDNSSLMGCAFYAEFRK